MPDTQQKEKKILLTGAAGFIGFHLAKSLLSTGKKVIGIDNLNDYYDVELKNARLDNLRAYPSFEFIKGDLSSPHDVELAFDQSFDFVVHLAAQAGVRYSITNPRAYIDSNIIGFFNILEACRHHAVKHLVYASSSSVYGNQQKVPYSVTDDVSYPISLYAATKRSNELMAYTYSHLYNVPTTGLRFFTVYGPWGRPDMAYYSFAEKMIKGETIKVFNHGDMMRDFTYVDDVIEGINAVLQKPPTGTDPAKIYNIGNHEPVSLLKFIDTLEQCMLREGIIQGPASKEFLPMQPGDVYQTCADVTDLMRDFGFRPSTSIDVGLRRFVQWYKEYHQL